MSKEAPSANDALAALVAARQEELRAGALEEAGDDAGATVPFLLTRLGERWFGLRAETVREVVARERITRVPGQPVHIRGVALVHGRLVPVVDLAALMGMPRAPDSGGGAPEEAGRRLVVLCVEDAELAILADDARGVIHLPDAIGRHVGAERAPFIAGEIRWQQHLVCVLDGPALVATATQSGKT